MPKKISLDWENICKPRYWFQFHASEWHVHFQQFDDMLWVGGGKDGEKGSGGRAFQAEGTGCGQVERCDSKSCHLSRIYSRPSAQCHLVLISTATKWDIMILIFAIKKGESEGRGACERQAWGLDPALPRVKTQRFNHPSNFLRKPPVTPHSHPGSWYRP